MNRKKILTMKIIRLAGKRKLKTFNNFFQAKAGKSAMKTIATYNEKRGLIGGDGAISSGFIGQNF